MSTGNRTAWRSVRVFLSCCYALSAICRTADAQTIPNSGELLQQTPRPLTPAPSSGTGLTISKPSSRQTDSSPPFLAQHIQITGNLLVSTAELHKLVAPSEGKVINLVYLEELAALITKSYQDHGFLLSRAYVPPQTLSEGTVRIAVLEARYEAALLVNTSPVSQTLLKSYLNQLQPGDPVLESKLERTLLLLTDIPGAIFNSTITAGQAVGTSDLEVAASRGAPYAASLTLDDAGNRYTGRERVTGTVNVNNPFDHGDVFSATALTAGPDLNYGRLGYVSLLPDGTGTTLGGSLSALYYHLGHGLANLHAHGTAQTENVTLMQPLIRSTGGNLFVQLSFDGRQLRDAVDATEIHTDRHTDDLAFTLAGDRRDAGGISNLNVAVAAGHLGFSNDTAALADADSAKTAGTYAKLNLSLARLQRLSESNSLYVSFNGQAANKNLDSSEQFFLGGPNSVRAYDVGSVGGAMGALLSAELRHDLRLPVPGAWQAIAFIDSGAVRVYKTAFTEGDNQAFMSGVGVGLNWEARAGWSVSGSVATPIGAAPALVGDSSSTRIWVEVRKAFSPHAAPP